MDIVQIMFPKIFSENTVAHIKIYEKIMNNSCLHNITLAMFHTYIFAKVIQYVHFILFRYTVYPKYLHLQ